jgi:vacuolar protein sorting-associated protein 13A/C
VIAGSANSVSKILMTLGNGISELSFDEEYQRERNENASLQPVGFLNGVKLGAVSFAGSLKSGITGVVEKPYEGAKKQGGVGFLQGSLYGLTGLVVKPVTGIIDLTSMTIQGIKSTSSYRT